MNLVKKTYNFVSGLKNRDTTEFIVIHHSGSGEDIDLGADSIHSMHINNGWSGIGYHYVVRKDGTVETGRPVWASGAHCEGENWRSVGIHVSGDFTNAEPTQEQLDALAELIRAICRKYDLQVTRQNVVGHREYNATACPGDNLYAVLDSVVAKAATM